MFVPERLAGLSPSLLDPLRKLDHLINRLFAVEPHDIVKDQLLDLLAGLTREPRSASTNMGTMTSGHP